MKQMFTPKLFTLMKDYDRGQLGKDLIAGVIVAIVALPLSIALALASGVRPEQGIYTAIIAGFIVSFLGGSRVQIAGPTAAFAVIVGNIVATEGMGGLIIATIMAGIILILMGIFQFGSLIKFIPYTITTGFTAGIAITIAIGEVKDFLGLSIKGSQIETGEKVEAILHAIHTVNQEAVMVGVVSLVILMVWPKISDKIPGSIVAVLVGIGLVKGLKLEVNTIGSLYELSNRLPAPAIPHINYAMIRNLLPNAFTIAILAAIESLLSCVVADGMCGGKHRSNMELIAQGAANIACGIFGGIPATGAIARTAANVKNGGKTPVAGMVHAVILAVTLVLFMPYAALIPMPTIAAILWIVAYNMSGWRDFIHVIKTSPKSDIAVLITTFLLTVVFDLVVAIEVGMVLAAVLFMKRMSEVASLSGWKYIEDSEEEDDPGSIQLREVPKDTLVYEINGPMFFGAADKFMDIITHSMHASKNRNVEKIVLRMRSVPSMDTTALRSLEQVYTVCHRRGMKLIFSHVQTQPYSVMKKAGFVSKVGPDKFCPNIDAALEKAKEL